MRRATELQVQIDDVYACAGSCPGCVLTPSERGATVPDMPAETLDLAVRRFVDYAQGLGALGRLNVVFAVADHFRMPEDYLVRLYEKGAEIVRAGAPSEPERSGVFITTSLVGKEREVIPLMRRLAARAKGGVPLLPLVVLDPKLLHAAKFGPQWRTMVFAARDLFGEIDLSINLSEEAVALMSPDELLGFSKENGFDEVTVNWTPTLDNAPSTLADLAALRAWLRRFDALVRADGRVGTSFRPVISRTISALMCGVEAGEMPRPIDGVELLAETISHSLEVSHTGELLPKFEAVGDVAHAPRFGFETLGNLADAPISDLVANSLPRVRGRILGIHLRGDCAACPVSGICAGTGFHVATHVAQTTHRAMADGCPHVARGLIEALLAEARERDRSAA